MKVFKKIILAVVSLAALLGCGVLYARFVEPNLLVAKRLALQSSVEIEPLKIVFFSDTHFGEFYKQDKLEKIIDKINGEAADLVIFGGDFFDAYYKDRAVLDLDYLSTQLKQIEAKQGKFAVWGNHDYGGGSSRVYEQLMTEGGFTLLNNQTTLIDGSNITVTGLDDYLLGNPDRDTEKLSAENFNILISHAPDIVDNMDLNSVDLILSGHSHGGQINLPFLTEMALPLGAQRYVRGLYDFQTPKDTKLFVSKGLGLTQLPYRFMSLPELVVIEVTPPNDKESS